MVLPYRGLISDLRVHRQTQGRDCGIPKQVILPFMLGRVAFDSLGV